MTIVLNCFLLERFRSAKFNVITTIQDIDVVQNEKYLGLKFSRGRARFESSLYLLLGLYVPFNTVEQHRSAP